MNPEQALQILVNAAAQAPMNAMAHEQWKKAAQILNMVIPKQAKAEVGKKPLPAKAPLKKPQAKFSGVAGSKKN